MKEIAALGVRRISVGGALARTAWGAFAHALLGQELDSFFSERQRLASKR